MIKKLRNKITAVITVTLFLVFAVQILTLNLVNYKNQYEDACRSAEMIAKKFDIFNFSDFQESEEPDFVSPNGYYALIFDRSGNIKAIWTDNMEVPSEAQLEKYLSEITKAKESSGAVYDMFYSVSESFASKIVVLTDNSALTSSVRRMFVFSVLSLGIAAGIAFAVAYLIARQIAAPVAESFEKQKQFISDAGHELKTPLTVIGANAELLESEIGDNKWLGYIRSETSRMNGLVLNLLKLAKIENADAAGMVFSDFDLSHTIEEMSMTFESVAFEQEIFLDAEIVPGLTLHGNRDEIKQLASILIDNAIKHSEKGSHICVRLCQGKNKGKLLFSVSNHGDPIPAEERERIFERFYRADESRSGSENRFGLGLSIAKSIVEKHKGSISVNCADGVTTFTAVL